MIILGIETSCDETALALIEARENEGTFECRVIQSLIHSQAELHSAYGGVFPTLAKREHSRNIVPLLHKLLTEAGDVLLNIDPAKRALSDREFGGHMDMFRNEFKGQNPDLIESLTGAHFLKNIPPIDQIAVTEGPGLEPALWVGINFARILGTLWNVPIIPVNHMEGHILGSLLPSDAANGAWQKLYEAPLPAIALLISGGHTELVKVKPGDEVPARRPTSAPAGAASVSRPLRAPKTRLEGLRSPGFIYTILGQTKDDAVGEAFDKAARLLGLPYPGGPYLAELSHKAWQEKIPSPVKLPRPMLNSGDLDFSFAGLKTAVLYAVQAEAARGASPNGSDLSDTFKKGLAHEFEQAVSDTLDTKLRMAIEQAGARSIILGGGVAANHALRQRLEQTAKEFDIPLFMPSRQISGDNALMIAIAGALHHRDTKTPGSLRAHGTKRLGVSV